MLSRVLIVIACAGLSDAALAWAAERLPSAIATGDLNGDGRPDIAILHRGEHEITVLLNDGAGALIEQTPITLEAEPISLTFGDMNGDGKLDLLVGVPGRLIIFLGAGNGAFRRGGEVGRVNLLPTAIAVGDFRHDGKPAAAVIDSSDGTVHILLGDGSGGLSEGVSLRAGLAPAALAV
jgi:VCBS repeat protein